MNTEYEIWTLMNLGLISNAMYMVAMVLLTWLGFRFAAAIAADPYDTNDGKDNSNSILYNCWSDVLQHCSNWWLDNSWCFRKFFASS